MVDAVGGIQDIALSIVPWCIKIELQGRSQLVAKTTLMRPERRNDYHYITGGVGYQYWAKLSHGHRLCSIDLYPI